MKFLQKFRLGSDSIDPSEELRLIDSNTPFAIREAYKALCTNILYLNVEDKCKKIAVTSAVSGEGKTTVSTNLAITLATNLDGKRVLLIDTDMRQSKVSKILSLDEGQHGLSEYLAGIDELPNIRSLEEHKIDVITAGAPNLNPTKLVGSSRMAKLLSECENKYDYVIIDTPPVNIVSDAVVLSANVNGYIISTRADYSNIHAIERCVETLTQIGAEIYGVVLSSLRMKSAGRGYGKYGYGKYGYSK